MLKLQTIYEGLLNEGASSNLYHFTYTHKLENILSTNTFYLTPSLSSKSDQTKGKSYFMSFSRTKSVKHGYGGKFQNPGSVRINVDGNKLSHNHKVIPIDYWQYPRKVEFMKQGNGDEMEDRVVSNNDEIKNANKYIISIDVFVKEDGIDKNIIEYAKKLNIQINYFNNLKDFANGNPNRGIKPEINQTDVEERSDYININQILGALTWKDPNTLKNVFSALKTKLNVPDDKLASYLEGTTKIHDKFDYHLRYNDERTLVDLSNSVNADLHNNKSSSNKLIRFVVKALVNDLNRNKVDSVKEYLRLKILKGKKTQQDFNKEFNNKMNDVIDKAFNTGLNNLHYQGYTKDGEPIANIGQYEPLKNYLVNKTKEIKQYTSNYILNNDDMFKYSYVLSPDEIKKAINIKDGELENIVNGLDNFDADEIIRPIQEILWEIDDFYYDEVQRIKEENISQWHNN